MRVWQFATYIESNVPHHMPPGFPDL